MTWKTITGDLDTVAGFRSAGAIGGIKPSGKPDIALIVADTDVISAATFTNNQAAAASVAYCREVLNQPRQRAIVVNSGNANCCTGDAGMRDTQAMATQLAEALACDPKQVYVSSTGVIGVPLPMDAVRKGIAQAYDQLDQPQHSAADAILTTDLVSKTHALEHETGYHMAGICKGSGMIHPNMATMLAYVLCDAHIEKTTLQEIMSRAVSRSFNRISVDNDESTNDTCILMMSAASDHVLSGDDELHDFELMLTDMLQNLAQQIVRDGEGASNFIEVEVCGCATEAEANQIAASICDSMLVKTAIAGKDPNWGRIVAAAGYSGAAFDLQLLEVSLNNVLIFSEGSGHDGEKRPFIKDGQAITRAALAESMQSGEQRIVLDCHQGEASACRWTSDLTHGYITINADYTT